MNTLTAAETTTDIEQVLPRRRRRHGPVCRKAAALLVALVAGVGMAVGFQNPAEAIAISYNQNFVAECNPGAVTAVAPDMTWYPNNAVVWAPTLSRWTDSGWVKVSYGPTQASLGDNVTSNPWSFTGSWTQTSVTFPNLPRLHYYRVTITYAWVGPGIDHNIHTDVPLVHHIAQGNFNATSWQFSTSSYCYIP